MNPYQFYGGSLDLAILTTSMWTNCDTFEAGDAVGAVSYTHLIQVMRFHGRWMDLGTWNTLTEVMGETSVGNVRMNDNCENVHVINELSVPILCMGLKNIVVAASPEGMLVSDKEQSSYIKPYVDDIHQQVMFAEKSWGSFTVLDVEDESLTIKVTPVSYTHLGPQPLARRGGALYTQRTGGALRAQ